MNEPQKRTLAYGANMAVMILSVLIILGIINWLSTKHYKRVNLTESVTESLSDQTRQVLKNLEQDVSVTYFYTQHYSEGEEETRDTYKNLLELYKTQSKRFSYEMLDYAKNPLRVEEFRKGMKEINIEDSSSIVKSGDHVEKINDTSESALTQAIIKVTTGKERAVCFTEGHGEHDPDVSDTGGYGVAAQALKAENYSVKKISVLRDGIPNSCTIVIVAGPLAPFMDEERARLGKWLAAGGKALLMLEPTGNSGLESLLKEYGITPDDVLLKTDEAEAMGINPLDIYSNIYDPSHPITEALSRLRVMGSESLERIPMRMFEVRGLSVAETPPEGVEVTNLVSTIEIVRAYPSSAAPASRAISRIQGLVNPEPRDVKPLTDVKSFTVAATAQKTIETTETPSSTSEEAAEKRERSTRIAVYGDSDWAADGFIEQMPSGDIFLNTIAWLAEEEGTIGIRPREKKFIPIQVRGTGQWLFLGGMLVLVPLALIINAVLVWREKKRM